MRGYTTQDEEIFESNEMSEEEILDEGYVDKNGNILWDKWDLM